MKLIYKKHLVVVGSLIAAVCLIFTSLLYVQFRISGPYAPLTEAPYFFQISGGVRELKFDPMFFRNHEVAVLSLNELPVKRKFDVTIRAEVYRFGIRVNDVVLSEAQRSLLGPQLNTSDSISFGMIKVLDVVPGPASVKVTVLQSDTFYDSKTEDFVVVIRPSPIM